MIYHYQGPTRNKCARFNTGKGGDKAVRCHPLHLTPMQGTSYKTPGLDEAQAGTRHRRNVTTSDLQMLLLKAERRGTESVRKNLPAMQKASRFDPLGWEDPGGGDGSPLQYSCLRIAHGRRSLAGNSPWGRRESDMAGTTAGTQVKRRGRKWLELSAQGLA